MRQTVNASRSAKPIVWSIAGSDSGGGAGIQADLLTLADLECHTCTAITANTAQNTLAVEAINAVPVEVLLSQLTALESDLPASAIKIGMLANGEQVAAVADFLQTLRQKRQISVVYDPVAVASSGSVLSEGDTRSAVLNRLLPQCDLVTPNLPELEWLTGLSIDDASDLAEAASQLARTIASAGHRCAVLVTGGHTPIRAQDTADYLWDGAQDYWLIGERIPTTASHGTGCSLSSAIAAGLAQGYPLRDACMVGKAYVHKGLRLGTGSALGAGAGPVGHCGWPTDLHDFPRILLPQDAEAEAYGLFAAELDGVDSASFATGFASVDTHQLGLYPVVDSVEWIEKLARLGVRTLQLRIKDPGADIHAEVQRAVAIGQRYDLRLFINDYWREAIACGAYGVHLGQEDLQAADLSAIKAAGLRLGISTHGFFELLLAWRYRPSYLAIGAIFATGTKDMSGQLQGVDKLGRMATLLKDTPLVAIGGITAERAPLVAATGVGSIAVVSAVTAAEDYTQAVRHFEGVLENARNGKSQQAQLTPQGELDAV